MTLRKPLLLIALGVGVITMPILAQRSAGTKPAFEVASVKPSTSADNRTMISGQPGGRFTVTNATLKMIVGVAYRVRNFQILDGPNWITTDRWNIEAKAEEGSMPPPTAARDPTVPGPLEFMVQSLLEDRFQLKLHRETKELPVYELLAAKGGPKM